MSGQLTVIGGVSGHTLTGLVKFTADEPTSIINSLQAQLTAITDAVTLTGTGLTNINVTTVASGVYTGTGTIEFTNANATGGADSTSGGSPADFSASIGSGYTSLIVEAPGSETVSGSGASNFLAVFSTQSDVTFFSGGGSGTVAASAGNRIDLSGAGSLGGWTVLGSSLGGDTINNFANTSNYITTGGSNNVIGLGGSSATVVSGGNNDLVVANSGANVVSLGGAGASFEMASGSDTVYATAGASSVNAFFFGSGGGSLDFINDSGSAASVTGGANGGSGSVTAFGGTGGGYYAGGQEGNNSLVGGTGTSTLVGAGSNNFLSVTGGTGNALFAGNGGGTLVGGVGSTNDLFATGNGVDSIVSYGAGVNTYFVGDGLDTLQGSTATGATNNYYFNQSDTVGGGGLDYILNFHYNYTTTFGGGDLGSISGGATIKTVEQTSYDLNGTQTASTVIGLSDNTEIRLVGLTLSTAVEASLVGGTSF